MGQGEMEDREASTVIDFSDNPKRASLYFDNVVSFSHYSLINEAECLKRLLPHGVAIDSEKREISFGGMCTYGYRNIHLDEQQEAFDKSAIVLQSKITWLKALLQCFGCYYPILYPGNSELFNEDSYDTVSLKLASIPLIDTSNANWKQIFEIRQDADSIKKLRRLRTFFHDNYQGKEMHYIQDDLLNRMEEHNRVAKDWGFNLMISSLLVANTSFSTAQSFISAMTRKPITEIAGTLCTAVAGLSLYIAREKYKLTQLQREPLAYIIEAKEKLEK